MDSKMDDLELCAEKFMYVFTCRQRNSGQNHNIEMANKYFKMWLMLKKDKTELDLIARISRVD